MITVKGISVRPEEVEKKLSFQDLTLEGQKRLFLEYPETFAEDILDSEHLSVRRLILKVREKCSSDILNKAIATHIKRGGPIVEDVILLLNTSGFELAESGRELLACAKCERWKLWVAQDEKTPLKLLKNENMFIVAASKVVDDNDTKLFDAIVTNPNFEVDEEIEETIQAFASKRAAKIRARIEELKK